MKLSYLVGLGGLGMSFVAMSLGSGCSSNSSGSPANNPTDSGTTSMSQGDAGAGLTPPPSMGSATTQTTPHNFALHTLQLGDTDRMGNPNQNAWENYGFNIDGKITTASSTDVCTLYQGAPSTVQIDGTQGTDNSFGSNILPLVMTVAGSGLDTTLNTSIASGSFTVMFDITGLDGTTTQTNTNLTGALFAGGKFTAPDGGAAMPTWTTADNWPVVGTLLNDPTKVSSGSKIQFPDSYIVDGTWVSGSPVQNLSLQLSVSGQTLTLNVHQAVVTMTHGPAATHMANGTIAGVIDTQELLSSLMVIAGHLSQSLCSGPAFQSIAVQIEQDSDILDDGTNSAGTPCTAISIGLGFTADEIGLPMDVAPVGAPGPNPCGDGG